MCERERLDLGDTDSLFWPSPHARRHHQGWAPFHQACEPFRLRCRTGSQKFHVWVRSLVVPCCSRRGVWALAKESTGAVAGNGGVRAFVSSLAPIGQPISWAVARCWALIVLSDVEPHAEPRAIRDDVT